MATMVILTQKYCCGSVNISLGSVFTNSDPGGQLIMEPVGYGPTWTLLCGPLKDYEVKYFNKYYKV
jgi:hypothetical protein